MLRLLHSGQEVGFEQLVELAAPEAWTYRGHVGQSIAEGTPFRFRVALPLDVIERLYSVRPNFCPTRGLRRQYVVDHPDVHPDVHPAAGIRGCTFMGRARLRGHGFGGFVEVAADS